MWMLRRKKKFIKRGPPLCLWERKPKNSIISLCSKPVSFFSKGRRQAFSLFFLFLGNGCQGCGGCHNGFFGVKEMPIVHSLPQTHLKKKGKRKKHFVAIWNGFLWEKQRMPQAVFSHSNWQKCFLRTFWWISEAPERQTQRLLCHYRMVHALNVLLFPYTIRMHMCIYAQHTQ